MLVIQDIQFARPLIYDLATDGKVVIVNALVEQSGGAPFFTITTHDESGSEEPKYCSGSVLMIDKKQLHTASLRDAAIMKRQSLYMKGSSSTNHFHTRVLYDVIFPRVVSYSKDYQSLVEFNVSELTPEGLGTFRVVSPARVTSWSHSFIR